MVLVCGMHRAGKTHFCKKLQEEYGCEVYSASELIENRIKSYFKDKEASGIKENQEILLNELNKIGMKEKKYVLDGHLCLLNRSGKIEKISLEILKKYGIDSIIVVVDSIKNIKRRLYEMNNINWSYEFIELFQNKEIKYAKELAKETGADLRIIKNNIDGNLEPIYDVKNVDNLANIDNACNEEQFDKNIILPIKQEYADKILSGQKKYEFRKNICIDNIEKIYIYATNPVKAIIGEAEVVEKIIMNKDKLWQISEKQSGITREYYYNYYKNSKYACAYKIGNVKRYDKFITLKDVGINYTPQSYIYVPKIYK